MIYLIYIYIYISSIVDARLGFEYATGMSLSLFFSLYVVFNVLVFPFVNKISLSFNYYHRKGFLLIKWRIQM